MKNRAILCLGYNLDSETTGAVVINARRHLKQCHELGLTTYVYPLGSPNQYAETGSSLLHALALWPWIMRDLIRFCRQKNITHLHDFFVLPLASLLFSAALKWWLPHLKFIKEIHNDSGFSRHFHAETVIRALSNQGWMLKRILQIATCYTRNPDLAQRYHIPYIPQPLALFPVVPRPLKRPATAPLRIGYLGHPLRKKGVFIFPELIRLLGQVPSKKFHFTCAFSTLGSATQLIAEMTEAARQAPGVTLSITQGATSPHHFFSGCDFYILPIHDHYGSVSTPNTVLEAMEAGTVPIVTNLTSLKGIIAHQKTGLLIETPTAEAVLQTLLTYGSNDPLLATIRRAGRTFLEQTFTPSRILARVKKLYAEDHS